MKTLTFLEGGDLMGVVIAIVGMFALGAIFFSVIVSFIVKIIYEGKDGRKFSKKQFGLTMIICLLICGLISGYICGGGF
ncbi:hypothetical protein [Chryseobacterium sp. PMSZPI]|uniref:hypothetical protein n=1 Tax=Chryseobacterium sp. PMSZPI TaxID=1033900 RepID=UPI000C340DF8|nr:hypothetical protein [Chryseobacterium sp. PMSZPI]PKF75117.1 hypothetical protein CW752_05650 [Chryseobacterium sp. PMSZPI]